MNLASLEERLADYGSQGYFLLETFVLQILKIEAETNGQVVLTDQHSPHLPMDAYAPKGLGEIKRPLSIEVTRTLNPKKLEMILKAHYSYRRSEDELLLIVTLRQMAKESDYVKNLTQKAAGNLIIWSSNELDKIIEKHSHAAVKLANNLFSLRLQMAVSRNSEDWKEKRDQVISEVSESYRSGRFSLVLGAGVSSSAGLPDWDTLLNSLFVSMLTDEDLSDKSSDNEHVASIVKRLRQIDGPSALMLARYIRKGLSASSEKEQNEFIQAVTTRLYSLRNKQFSLSSQLIKEIASLCTPTRTGAKVRSVITYNFDDLIERELDARSLAIRSIFEEVELAAPEELPIYHVHGFLPENRTSYSNLDRSTLVFSEEGYHQIYSEAYHWSNLVQLASLKETTCLMVGLSLTDPNLRRLLEISAKSTDRPKHFAFMQRVSLDKFTKDEGKSVVRAPIGVSKRFLDRHHSLNEEVMRELGVNVIWYETYDEIPKILHKIGKGI
ncbi:MULTISPECIES: SIR2 family protein [Aeromonas]|nr:MULTISPECIES: SIR2 family protein [Aeromonas]MDF2274630.1 SIR2 family protein [Aeromonas caviae]